MKKSIPLPKIAADIGPSATFQTRNRSVDEQLKSARTSLQTAYNFLAANRPTYAKEKLQSGLDELDRILGQA